MLFYADVCRAVDLQIAMDFMSVSSYGNGTQSSGEIQIRKDISMPIQGRDVIIVEDIVDSGFTMSCLTRILAARGAKSVKICSMLDKPSRRAKGIYINIDYLGFTIPDEFVVGYGLDYAEKYRNLPDIGVLKSEIYENN